jgi:hypothetical protein
MPTPVAGKLQVKRWNADSSCEKDDSDQLYDAVIDLSKESYPIPPGACAVLC